MNDDMRRQDNLPATLRPEFAIGRDWAAEVESEWSTWHQAVHYQRVSLGLEAPNPAAVAEDEPAGEPPRPGRLLRSVVLGLVAEVGVLVGLWQVVTRLSAPVAVPLLGALGIGVVLWTWWDGRRDAATERGQA